ncbi:MAG TPA: PA14 domain-containing protein, partial [Gemmatimonadaceae bacterium]
PRGEVVAAGQPVRFSYERFEPPTHWDVRVVTWNDQTDPRTHVAAFDSLFKLGASFTRQAPRLDLMWYRPQWRELPPSRWGLEATTTVRLPPGTYTLRTLSDDGIRVWVDDSLVIDNWDLHGTEVDYTPLEGGVRRLRVQYFQVEGWTELRVDIVRGVQRSPGSPGPH